MKGRSTPFRRKALRRRSRAIERTPKSLSAKLWRWIAHPLEAHPALASYLQAVLSFLALLIAIGIANWQAESQRMLEREREAAGTERLFAGITGIASVLLKDMQDDLEALVDQDKAGERWAGEDLPYLSKATLLAELDAIDVSALPSEAAVRTALDLRFACHRAVDQLAAFQSSLSGDDNVVRDMPNSEVKRSLLDQAASYTRRPLHSAGLKLQELRSERDRLMQFAGSSSSTTELRAP